MKIDSGQNLPEEINVIIEIPMHGAPVKYEVDKDSGALFVDRFMTVAMFYPANYGYVPNTLSEDGDPVDVSDGVFTIYIPPCKGDFNDDGYVDEDDLSIFAFAFGTTDCNWRPPYCYWWPILCNWWPPTCECDFDGDDDVDGSDHAVFVKDFGRTDCP